MATMLDPLNCGPATLAFCQDVQAEAFDYPESFLEKRVWRIRQQAPDARELSELVNAIKASTSPLIIAGGGAHYSGATDELASFAARFGIPVADTQAGKGALPWDHPQSLGSIGVTGTSAANEAAAQKHGYPERQRDAGEQPRAAGTARGQQRKQQEVHAGEADERHLGEENRQLRVMAGANRKQQEAGGSRHREGRKRQSPQKGDTGCLGKARDGSHEPQVHQRHRGQKRAYRRDMGRTYQRIDEIGCLEQADDGQTFDRLECLHLPLPVSC